MTTRVNLALATDPVRLFYAKTVLTSSSGHPGYSVDGNTSGYIQIQNIAYDNRVVVHYSNNGGTWSTIDATYLSATGAGYEVWKFVIPNHNTGYRSTLSTRFAIAHDVKGTTYWDNNNGWDYFSTLGGFGTQPSIPMLVSNIFVDSFQVADSQFSGTLAVKNISPQKVVRVRFTTDNWESYSDVDASYAPQPGGSVELWTFSTAVTANARVQFAVQYAVNGQTFWDNNFGSNYGN